ncbi:MAG: DNA cytosine methyltransferase [Burkholderiales bacterium]|nr:DNA cytosine methyltransferase [Burkholderiales bacterium]
MTLAYYNEIDAFAAEWLRNLITAGHIARGEVDERSIVDVRADDLRGFDQCHFFAGIGGWSLALRLAGWPDDRPVWTGSPPCQDHSVAGAIHAVRKGIDGERGRLARTWLDLVGARTPDVVLFENVPGIQPWLAEIKGRLAGLGYRVAERKRSSADFGAPHLRRRMWLTAHRDSARWEEPGAAGSSAPFRDPRGTAPGDVWTAAPGRPGGMADRFPARVAAVRAYGNAIDPWVARSVIHEFMECAP